MGLTCVVSLGFSKELLAKGVRADISLEEERVDAPQGVEYFVWLPTVNGQPPAMDKLEYGVQALEHFAKHNNKVYIHCKNGHGRAPTLLAAYLIRQGMTVEAAEAAIKAKRPTIHITDVQRQALQKFAQEQAT